LSSAITDEIFADHFSQFGDLVETYIAYDKVTGEPKGNGNVIFREEVSVLIFFGQVPTIII